jgi:hypothetical protein
MIRLFALLSLSWMLAACATVKEPLRQVPIAKANVLPLELSDDFQIRKVSQFFHDPRTAQPTFNAVVSFERQRMNYGAVNTVDRAERYGNYYYIWWRAKRDANLTVRLEYRQENTGSNVQAKEVSYENAKGTIETKFTVIGDEFRDEGKVTGWRVLLIENGRIVGLKQSFLWN